MIPSSNTPTLANARRRTIRARADTREHDREALRHPRLRPLLHRLRAAAPTSTGFPVAVDIDYRPLAPMLGHLLNNVGDPNIDPAYPGHAKDLERDVVTFFGSLFRAPPDRFGYVTSGGGSGGGNLYALYLARSRHPETGWSCIQQPLTLLIELTHVFPRGGCRQADRPGIATRCRRSRVAYAKRHTGGVPGPSPRNTLDPTLSHRMDPGHARVAAR